MEKSVTSQIGPTARDYLTLALRLERHIPGFVDAYVGPGELRQEIKAEPVRPPAHLLADSSGLVDAIEQSDIPGSRRSYLAAQARAMMTLSRKIANEPLPYVDEVRQCFDIEPARTPDSEFDAVLDELEDVLPGGRPLPERMSAWRQQFVIAPELAMKLIVERIVPEVRRRTQQFISLPDREAVEFRLVEHQPWSGYNWYLGEAQSRVEINTDLPLHINRLTDLVCHEAYPGHHTEHALKEMRLYREQGLGEQAIQLVLAPEAVISEGIATLAATIIFPDDELIAWQVAELYPRAGITGDPERERAVIQAERTLRALSANAALLLHQQGGTEEDAVAYLLRYSLRSEAEVRGLLGFLTDPLWRSYIFTYHAGRDLLGSWLAQGDPRDRFRRLLTEQVTPSLVQSWLRNTDVE